MGDQTIGKILAEVENSRTKVIFSTQWIKAQSLLADKLKKQIQHQRETYDYIRSNNLKLQSEIVEAENNINSMQLAHKTINMANIELKKELLLKKQRNIDLTKRFETSEKKYDLMWLEAKNRYESIPHVQILLNANEKLDNAKKEILKLDELSLKLVEEIDSKTKNCADIEKKRAIALAEFIAKDIPKYHKLIVEKTKAIAELTEKIREFETKVTPNTVTDDIIIMPTLELPVRNLDALSVQSDKVNIKNTDTDNLNDEAETKEAFPKICFEVNKVQSNNKDDFISSYFPQLLNNEGNETENYSKRKLINILHDVKIDKNDALKMISKANINSLEPVEVIGAQIMNTEVIQNSPKPSLDSKSKEPIQSEEIEEIDMTSRSENILNPPSQFLDVTTITITTEDNLQEVDDEEGLANSINEAGSKASFMLMQALSQQKDVTSATKRVSFNLSSNIKSNEAVGDNDENYELNVSAPSDDGCANIKDMVMKKHNLDLSPQFVYAKNTQLQKNTENSIVTSKFFQQNDNINADVAETEPVSNKEPTEKPVGTASPEENIPQHSGQETKNIELDVDDDAVTSPNMHKAMPDPHSVRSISGFLFNHGAYGIPDSLDLSFSATGHEDGDDFPHCIDSSVLLSPKANLPSPSENNTEVSQEGSNFLTSLRKTGLSIFGMLPTSESKPDSNTVQNAGTSSGFSFNFGSKDEKKARGGLFSMFK